MKKVILFASVVAAAMIAGGVTAYTVGAVNEKITPKIMPQLSVNRPETILRLTKQTNILI